MSGWRNCGCYDCRAEGLRAAQFHRRLRIALAPAVAVAAFVLIVWWAS